MLASLALQHRVTLEIPLMLTPPRQGDNPTFQIGKLRLWELSPGTLDDFGPHFPYGKNRAHPCLPASSKDRSADILGPGLVASGDH